MRKAYNRFMDFFSIYKIYWNRGWTYGQLITSIITMWAIITIKIENLSHVSSIIYLIIIGAGLLLGPAMLGYPDYHVGTGKREAIYYYNLNPIADDQYKTIKKMADELADLRKEIKELRRTN